MKFPSTRFSLLSWNNLLRKWDFAFAFGVTKMFSILFYFIKYMSNKSHKKGFLLVNREFKEIHSKLKVEARLTRRRPGYQVFLQSHFTFTRAKVDLLKVNVWKYI